MDFFIDGGLAIGKVFSLDSVAGIVLFLFFFYWD